MLLFGLSAGQIELSGSNPDEDKNNATDSGKGKPRVHSK